MERIRESAAMIVGMLAIGDLFINVLKTHPQYFFAVVITIIISIVLHELAHGWVAIKLGDDTPIATGHMTLNPLVHMGIFSIVLLCTMGMAFGAMPVNRTRLRGKYGEALVAIAGPAANLVLGLIGAVAFGICLSIISHRNDESVSPVMANALLLLQVFGTTNFALMIFNLIPFPPLDGSYVAANLFPAYRRLLAHDLARGAMTAIFFALFLGGADFIFTAAHRMTALIVTLILRV